MRTIAIVNQKGGSGKTTTAINLAAALAAAGQRTLLIDMDPQSHCASGLAIPEKNIDLQIGDALLWPDRKPLPMERLVWSTRTNLDVIPSGTKLAGLESARGGLSGREDRDLRLRRILSTISGGYDWCLIDCPPYIGLLTFNALQAADEVLIPVETGYFALQGAGKQAATIASLARRFGRPLPYRVLPTMYDRRSKVADDVLESIRHEFSEAMAPVVIREDETIREACSLGSPVVEHAPESHSAHDYIALAAHVMEQVATEVRVPIAVGLGESLGTGSTTPGNGAGDGLDDVLGPGQTAHDRPEGPASGDDSPASIQEWLTTGEMIDETVRIEFPENTDTPVGGETLSRAAELAAKARHLASRSEEISRKIRRDPDVARAMGEAPVRDEPEAENSRGRFGAFPVRNGVMFVHPGGAELEVCIAGDHNGWVPSATKLKYDAQRGVHEAFIVASAGAMRYRMVVNGEWIADPYNPNAQANPYGGRDSIVIVPERAGDGG